MGVLEAHQNGFRYSNSKGEGIDVMYRNIKHAFFQPSDRESITILHFHLINPIMMGNKKTKDVQFYAEVMDVVQVSRGCSRAVDCCRYCRALRFVQGVHSFLFLVCRALGSGG